jgi:splicing factor 3B subunit 3
VLQGGRGLHLLHKTPLEGIPAAMCAFQDKLLVGMGSVLRLYDLGKKKLLRKCELRSIPTMITTLHSLGDRIYGACALALGLGKIPSALGPGLPLP